MFVNCVFKQLLRGSNKALNMGTTSTLTRKDAYYRLIGVIWLQAKRSFMSIDSRVPKPFNMAYASYEVLKNNKDRVPSTECPIIFIHELLDSKDSWRPMARLLHSKTNRKTYAVDVRNHGDSSHSQEMTYLHIAEDIVNFTKLNRIGKCVVIGHGMGGRAAMVTAILYPELVNKMIIMDASPMLPSDYHIAMAKYLGIMSRVGVTRDASFSMALHEVDTQLAKIIKDPHHRDVVKQNLVRIGYGDRHHYKWRVNLSTLADSFTQLATFPNTHGRMSYHGPVLFISARNWITFDTEAGNVMRNIFPKAEFTHIVNLNFWARKENIKLLTNILIFVNKNY